MIHISLTLHNRQCSQLTTHQASEFLNHRHRWYYDQKKLWHLRGRVRIRNVNGLVYESQELFWDGLKHELYSNVFSKVTTPERTLQGTYFLSDERMTHYTVSNSKGSSITESMTEKDDATSAPADTSQVEQAPLRPQTQKHAKTTQQ